MILLLFLASHSEYQEFQFHVQILNRDPLTARFLLNMTASVPDIARRTPVIPVTPNLHSPSFRDPHSFLTTCLIAFVSQ